MAIGFLPRVSRALLVAVICAAGVSAEAANVRCTLDVDGNGEIDALTDGLLIGRVSLGMRGDALVAHALGDGATRTDPDEILHYILDNRQTYDIDGDGFLDAPTDARMLLRHMFGLSGESVVAGAVWADSPRKTWGAVRAHLENRC